MTLKEARNTLAAKQKAQADLILESKGGDPSADMDMDNIKSIEGDRSVKMNEIRKRNEEMTAISKEIEELAAVEELAVQTSLDEKKTEKNLSEGKVEVKTNKPEKKKAFAQALLDTPEWKEFASDRTGTVKHKMTLDCDIPNMKAVFGTDDETPYPDGFTPEHLRIPGLIVPAAYQDPRFIDLIPTRNVPTNDFKYMEQTTRNVRAGTGSVGAKERNEGASYQEAAIEYTERTKHVRSVGHILPVTDEVLEDVTFMEGLLRTEMLAGVREQVSYQLIHGTGAVPQIEGLDATTSTHSSSVAKGSADLYLAIHREIGWIRDNAFAAATNIVMEGADWDPIRLTTANGVYVFGNPSEFGIQRLWGLPVMITNELTAKTAWVGAFTERYIFMGIRRGVTVELGFTGDNFGEGKTSIRAGMRVGLAVTRANCFRKITATRA